MNSSLEDLACLYVLDQLDAHERAVFEARLLREPALAAHVRELEEGLARGVRALPARAPTAGLLPRIEEKIDRSTAEAIPFATRTGGARPAVPVWRTVAGWGIAAVIALSLATLALQSLRPPAPHILVVGLDPDRNTFTELPAAGPDPDARFMQLAALAQSYGQKPQAAPANRSQGYALFDPNSRQGFLAVRQLPALTENQRYHLWVADALTGRVRSAGTLPLAGLNSGLYSFALEPTDAPVPTAKLRLFITVETPETTAQPESPKGKVVLGKSY